MSNTISKGQMFGRLKVIGDGRKIKGRLKYLCECSCEKHTQKLIDKNCLLSGRTLSCGCLRNKKVRERMTKHGGKKKRLYHVWLSIKERCYNINDNRYKNYGGRGITVCDEWKDDYAAFEVWAIENGYDENAQYGECTIDRIDFDKSYSPDNCRWISLKEQNNNRTTTIWLTHNGKTQTLLDWAKELQINPKTLRTRINRGWSTEDVLTPRLLRNNSPIEYNGETHSVEQWSKITGIPPRTIAGRRDRGWPLEKIFSKEPTC